MTADERPRHSCRAYSGAEFRAGEFAAELGFKDHPHMLRQA
jgi:hypothetical protein